MEIQMGPLKSSLFLSLLLPLVVATGIHASAQALYDNGAPALGMPNGVGDFADVNDPHYSMTGDVFTAPTTGTAFTINFGGIYYNGSVPGTPPSISDTFTISLYTVDGSGVPDLSDPVQTSTLSGLARYVLGMGNSREVYGFTGLLNVPLAMTAGDNYYLGISDETNDYQDFAVVHTTAPGASSNGYSLGADGFVSSGHSLSFALIAPEPSEWALIALSLAGLVIAGGMRKRAFVRK
jgi:hypothetical protein